MILYPVLISKIFLEPKKNGFNWIIFSVFDCGLFLFINILSPANPLKNVYIYI